MRYIVPYNNNISVIERVYKPDSYTIVGGRYVILNFDNRIDFLDVEESAFPKCYGLAETDILEATGINTLRSVTGMDLYGGGVVVGILDDGFDLRAEALRNADGSSKFTAYYNQTTGVSLDGRGINAILQEEEDSEIIRENFSDKENMQHGSMLASIVCGDSSGQGFTGVAPNAEIIGVAVRRAEPEMYAHYNIDESVKAYSEADIIEGINYITRIAGSDPMVILLPFESTLGSHTGDGILEDYIDWLNEQLHRVIITAAGNQAVAKGHTNGSLINNPGEAAEMQEVSLLVNNDAVNTFMTIVMTQGTRPVLLIESPTGEVKRVPDKRASLNFLFERSVFEVKIDAYGNRSGQCMVYIRANNLVSGIWKIYIQVENTGWRVSYNCYLPILSFSMGKVEFLSPVSEQTVTTPGDAMQPCTVGCYDSATNKIYPPSGKRNISVKPDFCAPGVQVTAYDSVTGEFSAFTGTSVSAAVTAGAAALSLQWAVVMNNSPYITGNGVKQLLIAGCRPMSAYVPDSQWGYGALDLYNSFEAIRR